MLTVSYFKIVVLLFCMFAAGAIVALLFDSIRRYFWGEAKDAIRKKRWSDPPILRRKQSVVLDSDENEREEWMGNQSIIRIDPDMENVSLNHSISVTNLSDEDLSMYIKKAEKEKEQLLEKSREDVTTRIYIKQKSLTVH